MLSWELACCSNLYRLHFISTSSPIGFSAAISSRSCSTAVGFRPATMQAIAKEMNFSETTFVLPPERPRHRRARADLHAGGGAADGRAPDHRHGLRARARGRRRRRPRSLTFGLGVGPTPVSLEWSDEELSFVWMTQLPPCSASRGRSARRRGRAPAAGGSRHGYRPAGPDCILRRAVSPRAARPRDAPSTVPSSIPMAYDAFRRAAGFDDVPGLPVLDRARRR